MKHLFEGYAIATLLFITLGLVLVFVYSALFGVFHPVLLALVFMFLIYSAVAIRIGWILKKGARK